MKEEKRHVKEEKRHVGRPTNEEVRQRKNKKIFKILMPITLIIILVVVIISNTNLSKLKGAVVTKFCPYAYVKCKNQKNCECRSIEGHDFFISKCKKGTVLVSGECHKTAKLNKNKQCPTGYVACKNKKNCECRSKQLVSAAAQCVDDFVLIDGKCYQTKKYESDMIVDLILTPGKNSVKVQAKCNSQAQVYKFILKNASGKTIGERYIHKKKQGADKEFTINKLDIGSYSIEMFYYSYDLCDDCEEYYPHKSIEKKFRVTKGSRIKFFGLTDEEMCKLTLYNQMNERLIVLSDYNIKLEGAEVGDGYDAAAFIKCGANVISGSYSYFWKNNPNNPSEWDYLDYEYSYDSDEGPGFNYFGRSINPFDDLKIDINDKMYVKYNWRIKNNNTGLDNFVGKSPVTTLKKLHDKAMKNVKKYKAVIK